MYPERIAYTVRRGDTLTRLARRYRTSVELMLAENPHLNPNVLSPGELISICPGVTEPSAHMPPAPERAAAPPPVEMPRATMPRTEMPHMEFPQAEAPQAEVPPAELPQDVWHEPPRVTPEPGNVWMAPMPEPPRAEKAADDVWREPMWEPPRFETPPESRPPARTPAPAPMPQTPAQSMPFEVVWPEVWTKKPAAPEGHIVMEKPVVSEKRVVIESPRGGASHAGAPCVENIWEYARGDARLVAAAVARVNPHCEEKTLNQMMRQYLDLLRSGIESPPEPCSESHGRLCGDLRGYAQGLADYIGSGHRR